MRKHGKPLASNFDKKDPEFVSLYDELKRLFRQENLDEITQDEMRRNIEPSRRFYEKVKESPTAKKQFTERQIQQRPKYARIHKRLVEKAIWPKKESQIFEAW